MRIRLVIFLIVCCPFYFVGGQSPPLTVKEISLMLRSGCGSETILRDLSYRHFAGPLDLEAEKQLRQTDASPALLDALKSDNNAASETEIAQAQQRIAETEASAKRFRQQQMAAAKLAVQEEVERSSAALRAADAQVIIAKREFIAAQRQIASEHAAARKTAAEHFARRPAAVVARQQAAPPFGIPSNNPTKEWELRNRIEDAVRVARREEENNARSAAHGGSEIHSSSSTFSSMSDDFATRDRIERAVEAARREEQNNARSRAHGGSEIHSSANSFDPGW
jgi:hypothetical protein